MIHLAWKVGVVGGQVCFWIAFKEFTRMRGSFDAMVDDPRGHHSRQGFGQVAKDLRLEKLASIAVLKLAEYNGIDRVPALLGQLEVTWCKAEHHWIEVIMHTVRAKNQHIAFEAGRAVDGEVAQIGLP